MNAAENWADTKTTKTQMLAAKKEYREVLQHTTVFYKTFEK